MPGSEKNTITVCGAKDFNTDKGEDLVLKDQPLINLFETKCGK